MSSALQQMPIRFKSIESVNDWLSNQNQGIFQNSELEYPFSMICYKFFVLTPYFSHEHPGVRSPPEKYRTSCNTLCRKGMTQAMWSKWPKVNL